MTGSTIKLSPKTIFDFPDLYTYADYRIFSWIVKRYSNFFEDIPAIFKPERQHLAFRTQHHLSFQTCVQEWRSQQLQRVLNVHVHAMAAFTWRRSAYVNMGAAHLYMEAR